MTKSDMSRIQGKRRAEAKATNKAYTLSLFHKLFGSSKYVIPWRRRSLINVNLASSSTMLTIFGGRVDDLRSVLLDERLPQGWESRVRKPNGLTFFTFNFTVLPVEFGVREADWSKDAKRVAETDN